jgi:hypothetical protein
VSELDARVDDLANPYIKRKSRCYEPSKNIMQAIAAVDSKGWRWVLDSEGVATIWHEVDGHTKKTRAQASPPAEALCRAFVEACLTTQLHKCMHCGKPILKHNQSCSANKGMCEVHVPDGGGYGFDSKGW